MLKQIIEASEYVVQNATSVKINYDKIQDLINEINNFKYQHYLTYNPFGIMELSTEDLINFLLIFDSIDFSFWGDPKWTINVSGEELDGGNALLYVMLELFKAQKCSFELLSKMTKEEFSLALKGNVEIPLLDDRYNIVRGISQIVNEQMHGNFYSYIKGFTSDEALFNLIINTFPSFEDTRTYKDKEVPLYKLAQLLTSDILHLLDFKEGIKVDFSHLIGCADYKIPQILRSYGILEYSNELTEIVDKRQPIEENDPYEVEIRASILVVINYIYKELNEAVWRIDINDYIWGKGRNKNLTLKPYHLTRTTSY